LEAPARKARASIAAIERHNGPGDPRLPALRNDLAVAGLEEHIKAVVDAMPPLTDEQLSKLAVLLHPGESRE
jgi:hypothetical protein